MSEGPVELLLVEDNPADQELTLHVLKRHNLANSVKIARDGAEAVLEFPFGSDSKAGIAEGVPRMILLDLKLPKVSGIEVLGRLKGARTRHIPVVALTSSRQNADLQCCYELGVNSYAVKPVDSGQFAEAVRQLGLYWLLNQDAPARSVREGGACAGT